MFSVKSFIIREELGQPWYRFATIFLSEKYHRNIIALNHMNIKNNTTHEKINIFFELSRLNSKTNKARLMMDNKIKFELIKSVFSW